ncbi:nicotinate-nucleotide--dimethylbenzimidazole phosphoribosyltransferase [Streptomyces sp. NBC_01102]|uniref:nicotinate-nucleotide--dimethylbenzimidazole phosphoribosyltransferase n=1 Tax=Streptomyces sp. NBC_01102 TaxID=2903749 RepID=UPI00386EA7FC|nr:nicotinate-nucleotide--dimethylbenzimidazole phosphoribosyltransferase [Streptomyces sp. NBC_01102]
MTDTGQIPGEGLPENAGMVEQPGIPAPDAYTFLEPSEQAPEDDDLLLMPAPQGAWSDAPSAPEQQPQPSAQGPATAYESGSVDLGGVRIPAPAPVQVPVAAQAAAPARRPLHRGPASPEAPSYGGTPSGGVVRSLADRGPAGAPHSPAPVRHAGPPTIGPEYFDIPAEDAARLPGPQLGEIPPQGATPWGAPAPEPVAQADPVVQAEPVAEAESAVGMEPVVQPEAVVQEEPVAQAEPAVQVEPTVQPEPVVAPEPVVQAEPVGLPEAVVQAEPVAVPVPAAQVPGPAPEPEVLADAETVVPEPVAAVAPVAPAEPAAPVEPVTEPLAEAAAVQAVVVEAEASVAQEIPADAPAEPAVEQPFVPPVAETPQDPDVAARTAAPALPAQVPVPVPVPAEGTVQTASHLAPEPEAPTAPVEVAQQETAEAAAQPEPPVVAPAAPVVVEPEAALTVPEPVAAEAPDSLEAPAPVTIQAETPAPEPVAVPRAEAPAEPGTGTGTGPEIIETPEAGAPEAEAPVPSSDEVPASAPAPGYDDVEREAVLRVMRERRDIRNGFRSDPIPHEILLRVLEAAHTAPSVGHSQPWDFVVIRSAETRRSMHELAQRQREAYAKSLPKARAKQFKELKIEAILDTPVNIVVTADPTRGGRHTLGRHTQPQMAPYSSALAVENLWLAARAEGLGVGWVSFFDEREMVRALGLPEHLEVVAYLCVGYVDEFPDEPELMQAGWSKRRPLSWVVHEETYGRRALPGEAPHDLLQETIANIRPLDAKALGEAWERQKRMTKPAGALGMLEIISAQLSGLSRMCPPPIPEPAAVAVFAGDHGVHAQGVTAWPQEVTGQMVANFLGGGAVCNAFAAQVGAEVCVVDVGVASELPATPGLLPRKVRAGTADFTTGPALTREEVLAAIEVGIETARDLVAAGNKGLLTGEMGIANTTASAALICVYTGMDPAEVTGRGTGINDEMHARKVDVVRRGLELHRPDPADPIGVLAAVGGLEHAAMAGFLLGGASLRTPVILDGVSAGAAALVARAIAPEALAACIAGHRSAEPGHVAALNKLGLRPLVDLDLRLGEGTGALLALPIVQSAARAMHDVATFDSAGVTEK